MQRYIRTGASAILGSFLSACIAGCSSIGPATVVRDRADYIGAIADSWKEQMLANVVRLRYADAPVFVDVSSVISSYALQTQVLASGIRSLDAPGNLVNLGANATYVDKPTITYTPLTGDQFTKSLLRPIPPASLFSLIQAGYPADFVLLVTVEALNGVYNRTSGGGGRARPASPEFKPLIDALRRLQIGGGLGMRLKKTKTGEVTLVFFPDNPTPSQRRDIDFVARTLKVKPEHDEIQLEFGATQRSPNELAVLSRSLSEILIELAAGIDAPEKDVAEGRTYAGTSVGPDAPAYDRPFVRIHSGDISPSDAYVAVRYRQHWFWIDDADYSSKRAFSFLMLFFSLAQTGVTPHLPVVTIPAN